MTRQHKPGERVLELRGLLHHLRELVKGIDSNTDLEEVISVGRELWRLYDTTGRAADLCKTRVRNEAAQTPGTHRFAGNDGTEGLVVVGKPRPVMRKGFGSVEREKLRIALGDDLYDLLFEDTLKTRPRPNFEADVEELAARDPLKASAALGDVGQFTPKPRVSFQKQNGSK
jgi:hypothetical protein